MLKFKDEQTYICEYTYTGCWTVGEEYKTEYDVMAGRYVIDDDFNNPWTDDDINLSSTSFKIKEESNETK